MSKKFQISLVILLLAILILQIAILTGRNSRVSWAPQPMKSSAGWEDASYSDGYDLRYPEDDDPTIIPRDSSLSRSFGGSGFVYPQRDTGYYPQKTNCNMYDDTGVYIGPC